MTKYSTPANRTVSTLMDQLNLSENLCQELLPAAHKLCTLSDEQTAAELLVDILTIARRHPMNTDSEDNISNILERVKDRYDDIKAQSSRIRMARCDGRCIA